MGSRKKKIQIPTQRQKFFAWYRSLSIMDRIAVKSYLFNNNRGRINLKDLFIYPRFWQIGPIRRRMMVDEGYAAVWK